MVSSPFEHLLALRTGWQLPAVSSLATRTANVGVGAVVHLQSPQINERALTTRIGTKESIGAVHD